MLRSHASGLGAGIHYTLLDANRNDPAALSASLFFFFLLAGFMLGVLLWVLALHIGSGSPDESRQR